MAPPEAAAMMSSWARVMSRAAAIAPKLPVGMISIAGSLFYRFRGSYLFIESCAGRSVSLRAFTPVFDGLWTRVNALVTRASIFFARISYEEDGLPGQARR